MSIFQTIGLLGFFVYLASFAALQMRLLDGNGVAYAALNILAAALVLVSLTEAFNLASALIQISWIVIGLFGLAWRYTAILAARRMPERYDLAQSSSEQNRV